MEGPAVQAVASGWDPARVRSARSRLPLPLPLLTTLAPSLSDRQTRLYFYLFTFLRFCIFIHEREETQAEGEAGSMQGT